MKNPPIVTPQEWEAARQRLLVKAEPGERRRVRYRLRSVPMQVAQQFLAALARDWDSPLGALKEHLDRGA